MDVNTGGGAGVSGDVGTGGGSFTGRDSQKNSTTINVENTAELYRLISGLESRMSSLESMMLTRFLISDQQRDSTNEKIDEVRDEIRKRATPMQGPTWMQAAQMVIWIALIVSLLYFGNGVYLLASKFH